MRTLSLGSWYIVSPSISISSINTLHCIYYFLLLFITKPLFSLRNLCTPFSACPAQLQLVGSSGRPTVASSFGLLRPGAGLFSFQPFLSFNRPWAYPLALLSSCVSSQRGSPPSPVPFLVLQLKPWALLLCPSVLVVATNLQPCRRAFLERRVPFQTLPFFHRPRFRFLDHPGSASSPYGVGRASCSPSLGSVSCFRHCPCQYVSRCCPLFCLELYPFEHLQVRSPCCTMFFARVFGSNPRACDSF